MSFYYLNGWDYDKKRLDKARKYNCLVPLEEFKTQEQKDTYKWDVLSITNILIYLAQAGYEIKEY